MSATTPDEPARPTGSNQRWWLPVILAILVIAIIAIAYFATHPHVFGASATATPTATATTGPTATPKPGPTGTPKAGPTATAKPGPTGTPKPAPTASVVTGAITHNQAQLLAIQQGSNQKKPQYTYYTNPFAVVQHNLSTYHFIGPFQIVSPAQPPAPTPTPYTGPAGKPEVKVAVKYRGTTYIVALDQPVQKGPTGIWVIVSIKPA
jgi:hypothetical protein